MNRIRNESGFVSKYKNKISFVFFPMRLKTKILKNLILVSSCLKKKKKKKILQGKMVRSWTLKMQLVHFVPVLSSSFSFLKKFFSPPFWIQDKNCVLIELISVRTQFFPISVIWKIWNIKNRIKKRLGFKCVPKKLNRKSRI